MPRSFFTYLAIFVAVCAVWAWRDAESHNAELSEGAEMALKGLEIYDEMIDRMVDRLEVSDALCRRASSAEADAICAPLFEIVGVMDEATARAKVELPQTEAASE